MRCDLKNSGTKNTLAAERKISTAEREIDAPNAAERVAHKRFGVESFWIGHNFDAMMHRSLPSGMAAFMESLPFFFIATANSRGECDCSFRGREYDSAGRPYALLKVVNVKTIVFPDYKGNNFFNSLGNMLVNAQIGMLFIDFEAQLRARVNGRTEIIEDRQAYAHLWPLAQRYIQVTVEQAYGNCRSRIPRMKLLVPEDHMFQEE